MKRAQILSSVLVFAFTSLFFIGSGCSQLPVDPLSPQAVKHDPEVIKDSVKIVVDVDPAITTVLPGARLQLTAHVRAIVDTASKDPAVRNYVLRDSSVSWTILRGGGTITASGEYNAPVALSTETETVEITARANERISSFASVGITLKTPKLMPWNLGSYWVYQNAMLDTATGTIATGTRDSDSTVIEGTILQAGRATQMAVTYRNGIALDTVYYVSTNNEVWAYLQLDDNFSSPDAGRSWIKILDPKVPEWIAFDTTYSNAPVIIDGERATVSGKVTLSCNRGVQEKTNTPAGSFEAQKFVMNYSVNLQLTMRGITIPVQYTRPVSQWYGDGVGLVRSVTDLLQIINPFGGTLKKTSTLKELVRYQVN